MNKDKGASSSEDRAVVNGAGQAVSAVPASVPSADVGPLVDFFRDEGYAAYGHTGDYEGWSPEQTAVHFLRQHLVCRPKRGDRDDAWERARVESLARMVAEESGMVWADGHRLLTLGAHTGHAVRPIAFCEDAAWAAAIAQAIEARRAATGTGAVHESADPQGCAPGEQP